MMHFLKIAAIEPRQITRFEVRQWARQAYDLGVRWFFLACSRFQRDLYIVVTFFVAMVFLQVHWRVLWF